MTNPFSQTFFCFFSILCLCNAFSQTGPGGVGETDGSSSLKIWYSADFGTSTNNGNRVFLWRNRAGLSELDMAESGNSRPRLQNNTVNGYPRIVFNGGNRLRTGKTLTTSNFITNQTTAFTVVRAFTGNQASSVYTTDPLDGMRFNHHAPWIHDVSFDIGQCCGSDGRVFLNNPGNLTVYNMWSFSASPSRNKQLYRNGRFQQEQKNSNTFSNHSKYRFNLGGNTHGAYGFRGAITEIVIFNRRLKEAQRIIVENYLAAKYGLASSGNDLYTMDNANNGNYDHDVAGIGRLDNESHNSAQGTGIIRISNPSHLDHNEFLIWGHNRQALTFTQTSDIPSTVSQGRLERTWRVSEVSGANKAIDVGSLDLEIHTNTLAAFNQLVLLVDTNNNGKFTDETPILPSSSTANTVTFAGLTAIENQLRFTFASGLKHNGTVLTNRNTTYRVDKN